MPVNRPKIPVAEAYNVIGRKPSVKTCWGVLGDFWNMDVILPVNSQNSMTTYFFFADMGFFCLTYPLPVLYSIIG